MIASEAIDTIGRYFGMSWDALRLAATGDTYHIHRKGNKKAIDALDLENRIISRFRTVSESISFESTDKTFSPPSYGGKNDSASVSDTIRLAHSAGCTLNVKNCAAKISSELGLIELALQCIIGKLTSTNIFWSSPNQQGFLPHSDDPAVIVIQISGRKYWRLQGPGSPWPHPLDRISSTPSPEKIECLEAGDILILPGGLIHEAYTQSDFSMHLSVGIRPYTVCDALMSVMSYLFHIDPSFRRGSPALLTEPASNSNWDIQDISDGLRALSAFCSDPEQVYLALNWDRMCWIADRPVLQTSSPKAEISITLQSSLQTPDNALLWYLPRSKDVIVSYSGGHLALPKICTESVSFISKTRKFLVSELPGLTDSSRLLMSKELMKRGILVHSPLNPCLPCNAGGQGEMA